MCQNIGMARGWESKDVEAQVEANQGKQPTEGRGDKTPSQIVQVHERQVLQLSRIQISSQLENATHPNHRKTLEAALAHIEQKLRELA